MVRRALLSVSDKRGISEFGRRLADAGVELISTGGTAAMLKKAGVAVTDVSAVTGFPEMMDGRVKTLHPAVHGGILARQGSEADAGQLAEAGYQMIDLVVVNLYPFSETVRQPGISEAEAVEQIDIGGPTMLRSAAKNFDRVTAVCDPADYQRVADAVCGSGEVALELRRELAIKVFRHTAEYDTRIAAWFGGNAAGLPEQLMIATEPARSLRYGENPHQPAAFYPDESGADWCTAANLEQLQGKELSFNNIADISTALDICRDFADDKQPFCCILKHANPCGAALGRTVVEAFEAAWAGDPVSSFGGILGFTAPVDGPAAEAISNYFVEIVAAPDFTPDALRIFTGKKNLRVMRMRLPLVPVAQSLDIRRVSGGFLVQQQDQGDPAGTEWKTVTERKPDQQEEAALRFAWKICRHIKSNAICYAGGTQLYGVGAGQMSRVDAAEFGAQKSQFPLEESVLASDAFFPFRDGIDAAAARGVKAIIQPGGSIRDREVIDACNEHGIAMVFTGVRHFRH